MNSSSDYVDMLKSRHGLVSNYAVGKFLGVTHTTVKNWQIGKSMSEKHARAVAHALELPEMVVLMDVAAEKAATNEAKAGYIEIADMLREAHKMSLDAEIINGQKGVQAAEFADKFRPTLSKLASEKYILCQIT